MLVAIAHCAGTKSFEDDLDLVDGPRIGSRLGGRWKSPRQVLGKAKRELLEIAGVENFGYLHGIDARNKWNL
jgi:hypothetical protein